MAEYEHEHTERGLRGEDYVARRDGLEEADAEWCDLRNPRTGSAHEVKVAAPSRRFRLWEDQHASLSASDRAGTAWYHFLVVTMSGNVVDERKAKPSTVTRLVQDRGGWNESGHRRAERQHKLPTGALF